MAVTRRTDTLFQIPDIASLSWSREELGVAVWALDNAGEIVERHRDKSDYDKLAAYRDEICRLVSYDYEAAESEATIFGDPWQMVYVFDLDPSTNVVCEGYAKAFKYLCDLSRFDGDAACRIAAGAGTCSYDPKRRHSLPVHPDGGSGRRSAGVPDVCPQG